MWSSNKYCRLCLICSRTKDLVTLNRIDRIPDLLDKLADIIRDNTNRSRAFTEAFEVIKCLVSSDDPYAELKAKLNEVGRSLKADLEKYLEERGWDVWEAIRLSAAANIIDTSVLGYEAKDLREAIWDRPAIEEKAEIPKHEHIYLVLDNAGEALIDLLLAKALALHGYDVKIVVRSKSYEIDVLRDNLETDVDTAVDIIETPGSIPPIMYIDRGFVIAKGIANAEAYVEGGKTPSLHLFRAKCDVLADLFAVHKNAVLIVTGDTLKRVFKSRV